ncbi:hypothetical protein QYE76_032296 [Lolium multiflorum]|uniref:Myb/SANT-like domain-containing protein n=1 Tax=Lolium multiflorum TaxID=4521 RepID=A0AAD8QWX6_LOLMU|nr:hypothetical protein QYE76_032296 [Lolium multiflorum]
MEMAGAGSAKSEKGEKDSHTSHRAPWPISTPPPLSPQISSSSSHRQAVRGARISGRRRWQAEAAAASTSGYLLVQRIFTSAMTDTFCDEFSQALVCVGHSQIPSQIPDSQPTYESKVTPLPVSDLVAQVAAEVAASFVLEKMCGLIQSGVRTDKGFKEVHLNVVAKGLADHSGVSVCSTQVYNHLRKWRQRWLTISRLRDLSGAQWCEDTKSIVLESEHYCGHVANHPKDAEFLNVPIANYDEMHTIFTFGLATGKYAMGSSEPLGSAALHLRMLTPRSPTR